MPDAPAYRKKLIEVDLPLAAISKASVREKHLRHGHPSTLHIWWARRPLAACRAVLFASMVDDPSALPDEFPTEEAQRRERSRLHSIIERLVVWENSNNEGLLAEARYEIARSVARSRNELCPASPDGVLAYLRDYAPPVYDPFAGGGSIPLEAQRLGLRAVASDLNPVAVLINKALIELPPKVAGKPPVNPDARSAGAPWRGAAGLAADVRYYGKWMRDQALERIGHLYPKAKLPDGGEATVIAWLWARTIPCPNPACGVPMPMMKTFELSERAGNRWWARPVVDAAAKRVSFVVQDSDEGVPIKGTVDGNGALCLACRETAPLSNVRKQSKAGKIKMGEQMIAIVADGKHGRIFLSPSSEHIRAALSARADWRPEGRLPDKALGFRIQNYGFTHWSHVFTARQTAALTTFSDLIGRVGNLIEEHGANEEYVNIIKTYLGLALGKLANGCSNVNRWENSLHTVEGVFSRQAISMIWDFAETNPFSRASQNWINHTQRVAEAIEYALTDTQIGSVYQSDASAMHYQGEGPVIVTDPPYYDNIGYADLSDFFYVWLRPSLRIIYPDLFASMLVPKEEEVVAAPRFAKPKEHFEGLLSKTLLLMRDRCSDSFPSSLFYAYKQQEERREGMASTGWEMMLSALIEARFQIVGTWPMRTELANRQRGINANALATSVVIVCRPRAENAPVGTRTQFLQELERELPVALDDLTHDSHIGPVDLAQAAIGPGMEIYSRYARIERVDGSEVGVREALQEINNAIAAYDESVEGELDPETRVCMGWIKQHGYAEGQYDSAHTLAQAHNLSVERLGALGLMETGKGFAQLIDWPEYREKARPSPGMTAWDGCFRIVYHLQSGEGGGVEGAARIAAEMGGEADRVERLARILYNHYDRKRDSQRAVLFNELVKTWPQIKEKAQGVHRAMQTALGLEANGAR